MEWQSTDLWVDMTPAFWGLIRTPENERNMLTINHHIKKLATHLEILYNHLVNRDFTVGKYFAMGDIPVGSGIYRYMSLPIERPHFPNIKNWYARLQDRKAYRDYVMIPIS